MSDNLWQLSASSLTALIKQRKISCREVMQAHIKRLQDVNPIINAVVDFQEQRALLEADNADKSLQNGDDVGILHGVPITIKVNVDQKGFATTNGIVAKSNNIASKDSAIVSNLRKAGAVMLGRTNTPAFSLRWFTDNDLYGRTINPHNNQLTPGGSSGGAACAVATGLGAIAHGNDQGGSIRYPAYACGVYGLRPSFQRMPSYNHTNIERPFLFEMTAVQGPFARNVKDLRLALTAMSYYDCRDPWQIPITINQTSSKPIKVALCKELAGYKADLAITKALEQAAIWLQQAGYIVEEVIDLPNFDECKQMWLNFTVTDVINSSLHQDINKYGDAGVQNSLAIFANQISKQFNLSDYNAMLARRNTLRRAWLQFLQKYPLVLMPVSWSKPFAFNADEVKPSAAQHLIDAQSPLIAIAAMGLPGLSIPMPFNNNIPCGVQIIGKPFSEEDMLNAAQIIENNTGELTTVNPSF